MKPLTHQIHILKELKEKNKALIFIPSGAGKTHTIAFDVLEKKPKSMLYIVHRNEILFQTIEIFKEVCGCSDEQIGILNANRKKDFSKKYLFATNMTLGRTKNLEKLPKDIEYIIIDEFHHVAASTYQRIIEYFQPKYLYGLTATPERADLRDIKNIIENNVVGNIDIFIGIEQGILVPFDYRGFWDNIDYSDIEYQNYRYRQHDLDKKLLIDKRDKAIIKKYKEIIEPQNRLTIGFCNSVKHVKRMTKKFREAGIFAAGITYMEPFEQRKQILHGFRNGTYKVLFTRDILNEGVDFPECEALLFLRPTMSKVVFLQQLGRGLRIRKGKKDVLVLDFIGNYHNAFKVREYLKELTEPKYTGKQYKPEYNHNVPTVYFDEKIVEMFDLQKLKAYNPTKEMLIQDYKHVTEILGYPPRFEEWNTNPKIKHIIKYSRYQYAGVFGNLINFYKEMGLNQYLRKKHSYCKDKKELIRNYKNLGNILKRTVTMNDIDTHPESLYYTTAYQKTFGGMFEFRQYIKEKGRRLVKTYDKDWIVDAYKKLAEKLGRDWITESDWRKEYDKKGYATMQRKYGGLAGMRKILNITGFKKNCVYCGKEFIVKRPYRNSELKLGINTLITKRYCSLTCSNRRYNDSKYRAQRREPKIKNILENYSNCVYCNKKIDYPFLKNPNEPKVKFIKKRYCSSYCRSTAGYHKRKKNKF